MSHKMPRWEWRQVRFRINRISLTRVSLRIFVPFLLQFLIPEKYWKTICFGKLIYSSQSSLASWLFWWSIFLLFLYSVSRASSLNFLSSHFISRVHSFLERLYFLYLQISAKWGINQLIGFPQIRINISLLYRLF